MDGDRAHAVFSDPPYNVRIDGNVSGLGTVRHREFAMASGEMTQAEFTGFLTKAFSLFSRNSVDGSLHFVCMDWRHLSEMLAAGNATYTEFMNLCVWAKDNAGMGSLYRSQHELIFVFKKGRAKHRNNVQLGQFGRNRTNVWRYPNARSLSRSGDEGNLLAISSDGQAGRDDRGRHHGLYGEEGHRAGRIPRQWIQLDSSRAHVSAMLRTRTGSSLCRYDHSAVAGVHARRRAPPANR